MSDEKRKALDKILGLDEIQWPVPIVELITPNGDIKIYANGVVEGLPPGSGILNHIPLAIRPEVKHYFSKRMQSPDAKSPTESSSDSSTGA